MPARLRTATALATSMPWSSAKRAATWLPPNMQASNNSMTKALGLRAPGSASGVGRAQAHSIDTALVFRYASSASLPPSEP